MFAKNVIPRRCICSSIEKALISETLPSNPSDFQPADLGGLLKESSENDLLCSLKDVRPNIAIHSYTLTPYINQSPVLKTLLSMGVDLVKVEKQREVAGKLLKMDAEHDLLPYLLFLRESGIGKNKLSQVISRFPRIFLENIENLKARVEYLKNYGFPQSDVSHILSSAPGILKFSVKDIDKKMYGLRLEFVLSVPEMIKMIIKCPRILTFDIDKCRFNKLSLKDMAGFDDNHLKNMAITSPKIFTGSKRHMINTFDFLHYVMGIDHSVISEFPQVFRTRQRRIEERHQFLSKLGRDQYNSAKPNFVSLHALISGSDEEFAIKIAKSNVDEFNLFLKTL